MTRARGGDPARAESTHAGGRRGGVRRSEGGAGETRARRRCRWRSPALRWRSPAAAAPAGAGRPLRAPRRADGRASRSAPRGITAAGGAARHGAGAAPPLRAASRCSDQAYDDQPLAIGAGRTHLPALHRGADDLAARARRATTRCSRWAPARATTPPCCRASRARSTRSRSTRRVAQPGEQAARRARLPQRPRAGRATATRAGPTKAPFDAILLSAAPPQHPASRCSTSSASAARWWCRWASFFQDLLVITKTADGLEKRTRHPGPRCRR